MVPFVETTYLANKAVAACNYNPVLHIIRCLKDFPPEAQVFSNPPLYVHQLFETWALPPGFPSIYTGGTGGVNILATIHQQIQWSKHLAKTIGSPNCLLGC